MLCCKGQAPYRSSNSKHAHWFVRFLTDLHARAESLLRRNSNTVPTHRAAEGQSQAAWLYRCNQLLKMYNKYRCSFYSCAAAGQAVCFGMPARILRLRSPRMHTTHDDRGFSAEISFHIGEACKQSNAKTWRSLKLNAYLRCRQATETARSKSATIKGNCTPPLVPASQSVAHTLGGGVWVRHRIQCCAALALYKGLWQRGHSPNISGDTPDHNR